MVLVLPLLKSTIHRSLLVAESCLTITRRLHVDTPEDLYARLPDLATSAEDPVQQAKRSTTSRRRIQTRLTGPYQPTADSIRRCTSLSRQSIRRATLQRTATAGRPLSFRPPAHSAGRSRRRC